MHDISAIVTHFKASAIKKDGDNCYCYQNRDKPELIKGVKTFVTSPNVQSNKPYEVVQ
jgi:hypothetical protein